MTTQNFIPVKAPAYFQCPNELVDHWLPLLKETELKVLLVIIRKTFGWHKKRDRISISQLMKFTGLSRQSVITASDSLANKGIILKETFGNLGQEETFYELIVIEDSNNYDQSKIPTPPSLNNRPPPVQNLDSQKKSLKEKEKEREREEKINKFVIDCLLYRFKDDEKLPFSEANLRDFIEEFGLSSVANSVYSYMQMNKSERKNLYAPSGWLKNRLKKTRKFNE